PSPLKSPTPTMLQLAPGWTLTPPDVKSALPVIFEPFMNQAATSLVAVLRQIRSLSPSRLKSPTPTTVQVGSGFTGVPPEVTNPLPTMVEPFRVHSASEPEVLRQSRSDLPSPSKSP